MQIKLETSHVRSLLNKAADDNKDITLHPRWKRIDWFTRLAEGININYILIDEVDATHIEFLLGGLEND